MIKCLSFDFDRTLSHVVPFTHHYIPKLLSEKGYHISIDDFIQSCLNLRKNLPEHLSNRFDQFGTLSQTERSQFIYEYNIARIDFLQIQSKINNYEQVKIWIVEQLMANQRKILYSDVVETIRKLYLEKYQLYILSGNHSDGIIELLKKEQILHYFNELFTVDKFESRKIDNFKLLIKHCKLPPKEILHIGDDLNTDGKANDYNINTLIMRRPHQLVFDGNENISNFHVITELSELFDYLK